MAALHSCRLLLIQTDAVVEVCHCDEDAMTCFNHVEKCAAPYLPECYGQRMSDDCDGDRSRRSPRRSAAQAADFRAEVQESLSAGADGFIGELRPIYDQTVAKLRP